MQDLIKEQFKNKKVDLTYKQYQVCFLGGTEKPFSGEYVDNKKIGVYKCTVCDKDLFSSDTKYDSKSGWPSFFAPINDKVIKYLEDTSHGMIRTEVRCNTCGSHLGHIFRDGPKPTGKRYCINSLSLKFVQAMK